jgi:pyruvate ferredoxin oxidoreductase gamma subunit
MSNTISLIEIRWHGRGGQGAVTSAELIAQAAISEGKYAQAFPTFGPERRGAPVQAFTRIDATNPIRVRSEVLEPDVVVVFDLTLMASVPVTSGLKKGGLVILNTRKPVAELKSEYGIASKVATVDATTIAREALGVPIVNTTMIGALIKATGAINLESMKESLQKRFGRLAEANFKAMERAFKETIVGE